MKPCPDCGRLPGMTGDRCGAQVKYHTHIELLECQRVTIARLRQELSNAEAELARMKGSA